MHKTKTRKETIMDEIDRAILNCLRNNARISNRELAAIFRQMAKKNKYVLSKEFDENLVGAMAFWTKKRDRHFGNGRFVRNKFEKAVENQSLRLSSIEHPTKEQLITLELTDVGLKLKK